MSSQGRRGNSARLFRVRENCLFRKLKRNMCNDSRSTLMPTGGQWRTCETPPQAGSSVSDCGINRAVEVKTFSRPPEFASHLQEFSAMDTDMDPLTGSGYTVSDDPRPSNFILNNHQCRLSSNSTIMDLDSEVDPETGERAQG